jgi:alpha-1,6-mannosyltransferase
MPIKTLHLTNAWSETSGGIAVFYRALLEAGNRREHSVRLVVPAEQDGVEEVGRFGRIYHLKARRARLNSKYRIIYPNQFALAGSKIQQILAAERPELVEINDKYALNYLGPLLRLGLAGALNYRPVVVGLSCERMDRNFAVYISGSDLARRFCRAYMRWLYFPFFDHHIAISRGTLEELRDASSGHIVRRGAWILPLGVDQHCFSPARRTPTARRQLEERAGADPKSVLLLYVGRLSPEKNLALLLETMERLGPDPVDYRLLVVGDGISRVLLEEESRRRLPERVRFFGHISDRGSLARIYANCDFFLHPNANEPFGIAPLEAMASGLVLVAPDSGGVTEYANGQNACLAPPTAEDFAGMIRQVVRCPELRQSVAASARATAEALSWESVTDSYLHLYNCLWRVGKGAAPLQEAGASFLSTPPGDARRCVLAGAATAARNIFAGFSRLAPSGASNRSGFHTPPGERNVAESLD